MFPLADNDPRSIGRYEPVASLGEGGMGRVYLAIGPDGRRVAVKRILPHLSRDPGFRQRFTMEVEAARRVSGPHTVPVVDADTEADDPWSATEFVAGPTLIEAIERGGPLPEPVVRELGAALASALSDIHGAGLIHRDIKPSNVLLASDGPKLLDFGISRALDYSTSVALTQTGGVVGSPGYMSPEQAESRTLTEKSDVFGLGCLLATAAAGRAPFEGPSIPQILYKVVHGEPELEAVPESLRETIERCLAKDPADRPSAMELRESLGADGEASARPLPVVAEAIAEQEARLAQLLAARQPNATLVDDGATMALRPDDAGTQVVLPAPGQAPPRPAAAKPKRRKPLAAAVAVAAALLLAIPLWMIFGSNDDPSTKGDNSADSSDDSTDDSSDDTESQLEIPSDVCDAFDMEGLLELVGPEAKVEREPEEGEDSGDDFASCSGMVTTGLTPESLLITVARNDRSSGGDLVVCNLEGCDGIEPLKMPDGESTERPWTKGGVVENSAGNLEMMWYQDDLAVWVQPFASLDDGSQAEKEFLLNQGVKVYDLITED
ncbi:serine/threonine-protein kinase [Stackebrandtia nassauensis]|uniref:Serine/threonine protein kinase n=1 Tax=Stackebrandtia nassauensis (strain DSM 44728 / CIP 108903 / NRRL B-16338 / NBRC 102104 / LLR-40K-21) TaxID=446470 RepID=D3Q032_STANL|nr:serine/threonine-protein kinase [Stackebrandtia nassauensis]ADD45561.1 serine/threonine protein kinase [Stackebrandtia nassauensis DSM 44728]